MLMWFIIGTVCILLELFTPSFILVFFGIGAWAAALTAALYPGMSQELIVFIVVTVVTLLVLRKKMQDVFQGFQAGSTKNPTTQNFEYIGKTARVSKDIVPPLEGEVFVGGSYWRASAQVTVTKDASVVIERQDAQDTLLLLVKPL